MQLAIFRDAATSKPAAGDRSAGRWLREAEFETGTQVNVRVTLGCLTLTAQEPQPHQELEVITTLRRACWKLSARKQRQITEFIQVIAGPQKRVV